MISITTIRWKLIQLVNSNIYKKGSEMKEKKLILINRKNFLILTWGRSGMILLLYRSAELSRVLKWCIEPGDVVLYTHLRWEMFFNRPRILYPKGTLFSPISKAVKVCWRVSAILMFCFYSGVFGGLVVFLLLLIFIF